MLFLGGRRQGKSDQYQCVFQHSDNGVLALGPCLKTLLPVP